MPKPCCGQPARPRRREPESDEPLPRNPILRGGMRLLYLGWGRRTLTGKATGLIYYVSQKRRKFTVAAADVPGMLSREVIAEH